jgi:uncharacterized Tic20 family protein
MSTVTARGSVPFRGERTKEKRNWGATGVVVVVVVVSVVVVVAGIVVVTFAVGEVVVVVLSFLVAA